MEPEASSTACSHDGHLGENRFDFPGLLVDDLCAQGSGLVLVQNQIGDQRVFKEGDVREFMDLHKEGSHDFLAGQVRGMENTAMAVAAFEVKVKADVRIVRFRRGEFYPPFHQLIDCLWTVFDENLDGVLFAKSCTRFAGVFLVQFERIFGVSDGEAAALGVIG